MITKAKNLTMNIESLRAKFGSEVSSADLWAFDKKAFNEAKAGGLVKIRRGFYSLGSAPKLPNKETKAAKSARIEQRFDVLALLADGVASKNIRSLMVAGAPGVGKTFVLEEKLAHAEKAGLVKSVESIKGSISPIGLYLRLWENRNPGQVLLLDDCDSVFSDEEAMNLLKGALDTSKTRRISWAKASSFLRDNEIPNTFDYEGQIVFITNTDPDAVIEKAGKLAPHMNALISRSVFLDLGIHDVESIMIRVHQVLKGTGLLKELELNAKQAESIVTWMEANLENLRSVSIRTVIQLASFVKSSPSSWEMLASVTMLKSRF